MPAAAGAGNAALARLFASAQSQPQPAGADAGRLEPSTAAAIDSRRGGGSPLPGGVRDEMGQYFGTDFAAVRIHTGPDAAALNRSVRARAFTSGTDVFFGDGGFDQHSSGGRELLAHELTHVVQQSSGAAGTPGRVSDPGDPAEVQAYRVGRAVADGTPAAVVAALGGLAGNAAVAGYAGDTVHRCGELSGPQCPCHAREEDEEVAVHRYAAAVTVQRDVDATATSVPPNVAQSMSEAELATQQQRISEALRTVTDAAEREQLQLNQRTLTVEQQRRIAASGQAGVARPAGLPLDAGYRLTAAPDIPAAVADQFPEGQLVTVTAQHLAPALAQAGQSGGQPAAPVAPAPPAAAPATGGPTLGGAASSTVQGGYAGLETNIVLKGLAPAGEHSVGVVAFPRWTPDRILSGMSGPLPEHPVMWGHSAEIVRVDGRIVAVRSYAPASLLNAGMDIGTAPAPNLPAGTSPSVRAGTGSTPAAVYNDRLIMMNSKLRSFEIAVPREVAEAAARGLPPGEMYGMARGGAGQYTAQPSVLYGHGAPAGSCPNCVDWAVGNVENTAGARVANPAGVPITEIPPRAGGPPTPHAANQGRTYGAMGEPLQLVDANGRPLPGRVVTGGLSPGMQVLKWGGRVMIVVGAVTAVAETVQAPPGEGVRTGVGAGAGFVGGLAAGAAAGLVCGPGALVCSVVLGGVFGFVGAMASRELAEYTYDTATGRPRPAGAQSQSSPAPCPTGNCHQPNTSAVNPLGGAGSHLLPPPGPPMTRDLSDADRQILLDWLNQQR